MLNRRSRRCPCITKCRCFTCTNTALVLVSSQGLTENHDERGIPGQINNIPFVLKPMIHSVMDNIEPRQCFPRARNSCEENHCVFRLVSRRLDNLENCISRFIEVLRTGKGDLSNPVPREESDSSINNGRNRLVSSLIPCLTARLGGRNG